MIMCKCNLCYQQSSKTFLHQLAIKYFVLLVGAYNTEKILKELGKPITFGCDNCVKKSKKQQQLVQKFTCNNPQATHLYQESFDGKTGKGSH